MKLAKVMFLQWKIMNPFRFVRIVIGKLTLYEIGAVIDQSYSLNYLSKSSTLYVLESKEGCQCNAKEQSRVFWRYHDLAIYGSLWAGGS